MPRVFLVHATPVAVAPVNAAFEALWPEARRSNLLDDSLATDLADAGAVDDRLVARFVALATYCRDAGADGVLFTCSSFGPAIDACKAALDVPVLKPDEAMIEEGLRAGARIAVLATFAPAVAAAAEEFRRAASRAGTRIEVETTLVSGALDAKRRGDDAGHDRLIAAAARDAAHCDAICFAQFSMAGAAALAAEASGRRVLTSADSAVTKLRRLVTPL